MSTVEFDSRVIRDACEQMLGKLEEERLDLMVDVAAEMYVAYLASLAKTNRWRRWTLRRPLEALDEVEFFTMVKRQSDEAAPGTHPFHMIMAEGGDLEQDVKDAMVMARYMDRTEIQLPLLRAFHRCGITLDGDRGGGKNLGFIR